MEEKIKSKMRQFGLSTASINNRMTVMVVLVILVIAGIQAYVGMPREAFPEVVIPQIYVGTPYPGNSPVDIEKLLTRPLEKEIGSISGIDKMTSTSVEGYSTIFIEFDFSVTPDEALRKVKDKVDIAMGDQDFPQDLPADPNVFEMNISELTPVMNINLSGDFSIDQLNEYAEHLEDKIEKLSEITEVDIRGVQDKEMKVNVDLFRLQANELSFNDIAGAIANENMTISAGNMLEGSMRRTVRIEGEFKSAADLGKVIIKQEKGNIVYLSDVADVVFEEEEAESYARQTTKPVVMVDVKKRAGENLINAADKIVEIIDEARAEMFPDNLEITITGDQSKQTRTQVNELENSIIFGMLLVITVLLFFLGLRNALFVGVAIPLSMFISFFILSAAGVTLNMMVLFALVLALGMLVDNGIVVVENIYRLMDDGMNAIDAAKYGVGEVAWPIIASTATTLAAFSPLIVWPGLMGEFMFFLPMTLIIVLGSSLFVALVINPVLTAMFMKVEETPMRAKKAITLGSILMIIGIIISLQATALGNLIALGGFLVITTKFILTPSTKYFQTSLIPSMERGYEKFLRHVFNKRTPIAYFVGTLLLLVFSFVLLGMFSPKVLFFPVNMPNYVNVFIEAPIGTDIVDVNKTTKELEAKVLDYVSQYEVEEEESEGVVNKYNYLVESVIAQVGAGTSDPNEGPSMAATPNKARITVSFVQFQHRRGVSTNEVMDDIRELVAGTPGVQITVDKDPAGPPQAKPINIEVSGDNYDELLAEAKRVKAFIDDQDIVGVEELKLDVSIGKPEMPVMVDRAKARRYNVSTGQIGSTLRNSLFGMEVSRFKSGEDEYPIMVRLEDKYRYNEDAMMNQLITFRDQTNGQIQQVPISAVASAKRSTTFNAVKRKDQKRLITVSSNVLESSNPNEVVAELQAALEEYEKPEKVDIKFTGQMEDQEKEMSFLSTALLIAVFLIFLILVAQFNSVLTPFIIVGSVVLSLIGVFLGLVVFQMDFIVIMTMIGIISLAGIVVNNAIVLIDYTKLIMDRKREELGLSETAKLPIPVLIDCMVEGGKTRLRPVLLTAITTVLGLVPLAVGLNIDFISLLTEYDPKIYVGGDNVVFWGPMSWTVIFGLTFATFLTLVIVPVMYYLKTRFAYRLAGDKELHL
ncbi:efflux RND transporter permease subunit [Salibacteraceae bacterium]|nr:efflux RND transporter permease subunit [Salibacteraceae bacterium]